MRNICKLVGVFALSMLGIAVGLSALVPHALVSHAIALRPLSVTSMMIASSKNQNGVVESPTPRWAIWMNMK